MFSSKRINARQRTYALISFFHREGPARHSPPQPHCKEKSDLRPLSRLLFEADVALSPTLFIFSSILFATAISWLSLHIFFPSLFPFIFLGSMLLPFSWLEKRVAMRAGLFAEDYPTALLATASALKIGLPPSLALERSVQLLAEDSLVRKQVEELTKKLRQGVAKEEVLAEFAESIRLAELDLFRSAFLLVLENGGRFAPTLEHLATTSRDRADFIARARVTTSAMRMTANVLIGIIPIVVVLMSAGNERYWELLLHHPTANFLASVGLGIIGISYVVLRRLSNFRP